jgi:hypothetical protein
MYKFNDSDVVRSPARSQGRPEGSLGILGDVLGCRERGVQRGQFTVTLFSVLVKSCPRKWINDKK